MVNRTLTNLPAPCPRCGSLIFFDGTYCGQCAYRTTDGSPFAKCQCEHASHFTASGMHAYEAVLPAVTPVKTAGGTFNLCAECVDGCAPPALEPGTRAHAEQLDGASGVDEFFDGDDSTAQVVPGSARPVYEEGFEDCGRDYWKLGE